MKERDRQDPNHLQKTLQPISHGFMRRPQCHKTWELRIHGKFITSGVAADGEDLPQGATELDNFGTGETVTTETIKGRTIYWVHAHPGETTHNGIPVSQST